MGSRELKLTALDDAQCPRSLVTLPNELLQQIAGALSLADQRRLAGTCSVLRAAVLNQAGRLTLSFHRAKASSTTCGVTSALFSAIRRRHGKQLSLQLRLAQLSGRLLRRQLAALGTCPAVQELELAFLGDFHNWTAQTSAQAAQLFPQLCSLKLTRCAVSLAALLPLLQRSEPLKSVQLQRTQLCSASTKHDNSWPSKLLSCTGFEALQIEGTHGNSYHALAKPGGVAKQLSTTITKLVVNWPGIGRHERWAELLERLPALQHLVLETNGNPNGWNGIPDGLRRLHNFRLNLSMAQVFSTIHMPHLHTLRLPAGGVYDTRVLEALLSHPCLRVLQLKWLAACGHLPHSTPVRLQRLELEEISITAVAYLPDAVLDALALPSCPRPNHPAVTRVTVEVWASAHIPGFFLPLPDDNDEDEDHPGEPCWCSVIRGVERLAPRMDRLAPILRLELDMNPNDEDLEALPRATLCARVRGLLYHLWPLGTAPGIQEVHVKCAELDAQMLSQLGAAFGGGCRQLVVWGMCSKSKKKASALVAHLFPNVGTNYKFV